MKPPYELNPGDRGPTLWAKAKTLIPGGGMLLSKRAEMFLPDLWPAYFDSASGIVITDVDGRKFRDFYLMGVGTNSLGYGHPDVDQAVVDQVGRGNMSSLNNPGEPELAEKLLSLHPWADMARFTRSGGEAMAVAVRIARAATGRSHVAVCGYHGWHDWYLSLNLADPKGLDAMLLPGLEPNGVPAQLAGTTHAFTYGDLGGISRLADQEDLAAIVLEVARGAEPDTQFLSALRELCSARSIVLIFDECTSGFRATYGGLHLSTGINPDMAMFGKALGNGYAVNAVIGRNSIMQAAQTSFISSTFWTEAIGTAAANKSLEVMHREESWLRISETGRKVKDGWRKLAAEHSLDIEVFGLDALAMFRFLDERYNVFKTFITQEMLKQGFLAGTSFYVSTAHTANDTEDYLDALGKVFGQIAHHREDNNFEELLQSREAHQTFQRLSN
jgi:glutamate-1-semialdehyde 2,1-aminomutase